MNKTRYRGLLVASTGIFAGALAVSAAVQVIQPPPSDFIDTEASTNVVFAPLLEDTRQYRLRFSGDFSPSNDLEVAFGGDANGDGDLSPEEIETQLGIDCGKKKVKVRGEGGPEVKVIGEGEQRMLPSCSGWPAESVDQFHCSPSPSTFTYSSPSTFTLKLTRNQQSSWSLIKVTRRGFFSTEPSVTLKPRKPGLLIIVK